jgi:chemotaxis signal transduction protein
VSKGGAPRKGRVIVVEHAARQYGLHVDDVREIVEVEDSDVTIPGAPVAGSGSDFVSGEVRVGDGRLLLLSLQKLLDVSTGVTS